MINNDLKRKNVQCMYISIHYNLAPDKLLLTTTHRKPGKTLDVIYKNRRQ